MNDYWLSDDEGRVLGPMSFAVVRNLALNKKLNPVQTISRNGRTFVPLREIPEVAALLLQPPKPNEIINAQADTARQIRNWIASIEHRPSDEIFRVPPKASRDAWRSAFFALIQRYVPNNLPTTTTPELRLACEDAFFVLAERIVAIERLFKGSNAGTPLPPPPAIPPPPMPAETPAHMYWEKNVLHVNMHLATGDARSFGCNPDASWKDGSFLIQCNEKVPINSEVKIALSFEGYVSQLSLSGKVVSIKHDRPFACEVLLKNLTDVERAIIRTWVAKARM